MYPQRKRQRTHICSIFFLITVRSGLGRKFKSQKTCPETRATGAGSAGLHRFWIQFGGVQRSARSYGPFNYIAWIANEKKSNTWLANTWLPNSQSEFACRNGQQKKEISTACWRPRFWPVMAVQHLPGQNHWFIRVGYPNFFCTDWTGKRTATCQNWRSWFPWFSRTG